MGDVHSLDDHRPHLTIQVTSGSVHVIPVALFDDVFSGVQAVSAIQDDVIRAIIGEWLGFIRENN